MKYRANSRFTVKPSSEIRHVRASAEKRAAEEIANREPCPDFERFKPLFTQVKNDLDSGIRTTRPFVKDAGFLKADIIEGQFFILGGQTAYVAEVGEMFKAPNGEFDARLRVIYSNGTESNLLRRSLQRALYKDEAGRRITEPAAALYSPVKTTKTTSRAAPFTCYVANRRIRLLPLTETCFTKSALPGTTSHGVSPTPNSTRPSSWPTWKS